MMVRTACTRSSRLLVNRSYNAKQEDYFSGLCDAPSVEYDRNHKNVKQHEQHRCKVYQSDLRIANKHFLRSLGKKKTNKNKTMGKFIGKGSVGVCGFVCVESRLTTFRDAPLSVRTIR